MGRRGHTSCHPLRPPRVLSVRHRDSRLLTSQHHMVWLGDPPLDGFPLNIIILKVVTLGLKS